MADKKQPQNVVFKKKTTTFSMIANPIIDDKTITPAAGWLYVLIQRWITYNDPDFACSKAFLASRFNSGSFMFNRAWDELKTAGYLKMYSHPTEGWQAELLDEAQPDTPHTFYLDLNGEVSSTNIERAAKKAEKQAKTDHYPENHSNGKHSNGDHINGNAGNNINTYFKDSFNTIHNTSINQSINHREQITQKGGSPAEEKKIDRLIDADTIRDIKNQIEYDYLLQDIDRDTLDIAVSCIAELYTATEPQTFNDRVFAADYVRERSLSISSEHIQYVFECFKEQREKVYNIRKYLTTAIFNAPDTMGAYYDNAVRADNTI